MKNWFKNLKIKYKMALITLIVSIAILGTGLGFKYLINTSHTISLIFKGQRLHNVNYHLGVQTFYKYLNSNNSDDLELAYKYFDDANRITRIFGDLKKISLNKSTEEFTKIVSETYYEILNSQDNAELLVNRINLLLFTNNAELDRAIEVSAKAYQSGVHLKELTKAYVAAPDQGKLYSLQDQINQMQNLENEFSAAIDGIFQFTRVTLLVSTILIILLLLGLTILAIQMLNSSITDPLNRLTQTVNIILNGDLTAKIEINSRDEIGLLATSLQNVQANLLHKVNHTQRVTQGDYTARLTPASEKDEFTLALIDMTNKLSEKDTMATEQDWLKTGQNTLSEKIRGEQNISELCQNAINYIAKNVNALVGTIYINNENDELKLLGSYAFTKRKNVSNVFKIGEGLVGQCALEKKPIVISNVPDDYIKINSGIGESSPLNILVTPLLMHKKIIGVIELGLFTEISELQMQFLNNISEMLAIAIRTAESRIKMHELLQKTQNQTEEMDMQREQLRVTNEELKLQQKNLYVKNEELEKQARTLKDSEAELQAQQEELRQTNEELEEKTESLEKYMSEISKKNNELRSAQLLLEERAKELENINKYKSEFLANMSHELRTPLNSLLILSKMLAENKESNLTEKQVKFASTIFSAGTELLELINDILDLSKVEAGKMVLNFEDFEPKSLANYIKQNYEHLANEKKLYLKTQVADNLPQYIRSDRQKVEQIMKNLISNALKFTQEGGITIDIGKPSSDVKLNDLSYDQTICICVADTGIGIPIEKQQLIFEAFQQADGTTSRKHGGTGLGLSISKEFTRILGGEIQVQSEEGKGTIFSLFLPVNIAAKDERLRTETEQEDKQVTKPFSDVLTEKTVSTVHAPNLIISSKSVRDDRLEIRKNDKIILIVEDDVQFAKILFDISRNKGFKCLVADDGEAGLQLAFQYKPSAILLNIELPRMDGLQVMERLKSNDDTSDIPVHFISVADKSKEALNIGAIGFLKKPVDMEDLNNAFTKIENILNKMIKKLLLIVSDETDRSDILNSIETKDVDVTVVDGGKNGHKLLKKEKFDCLVVDLAIKDIPGLELVKKIREDKNIPHFPIIACAGNDVSKTDEAELSKYTESIIIKSEKYMERLQDETTLFLHNIAKELPDEQKSPAKMTHDKEEIFKNKKILIVDDDMRNVFALSNILEEKGMRIVVGKNGYEGLENLEKHSDTALVLMDIMMPEMDGYEAMNRIRQQQKYNDIPIIALTAKAMKGDRNKCINAGANDYMSKPVDPEKLLSLLRVWLYK